jgi:tRNA-splicing ligase RtcB (3'-phosphate/5'-hydroxy nucleic acid ligase)
MSVENPIAPVAAYLTESMDANVAKAIDRVRHAEDVAHVAVMPDVHLAMEVCVGIAIATRRLVYPSAVGGDIGCGMLALAFDGSAKTLRNGANAGALLRALGETIPTQRRHRARALPYPSALRPRDLSHGALQAFAVGDAALQLGTLGGGNHFVEMQADENDRLWLMIHSGSRAMGQTIKTHHLARASVRAGGMAALDADTGAGQAYVHDQQWARDFAFANRAAMAEQVIRAVQTLFNLKPVESTGIACDHNHVGSETHFGQQLLVHRKGAMPAESGAPGVVPGSMGTRSFHVEGRGCADSLMSSAHGAGRAFSRHAARDRFSRSDLRQQMKDVWFDPRLEDALREESPRAYKDGQSVMRAQRDLVKIVRTLRPILVYKGR